MVVINLHGDIFIFSLQLANKALLRYFRAFKASRVYLSTSYVRSIYVLCLGGYI